MLQCVCMQKQKEISSINIKNVIGKVALTLVVILSGNSIFFQLFGKEVAAEENYYPLYTGTFVTSRVSYGDPTNFQAPYVYSDQYLMNTPSTQESAGLAHASAALVLGAFPRYNDSGEIDYSASSQTAVVRQMLTDMGYSEIENNDDFNHEPQAESFGVLGAHKVVDGCHLVALVPRSVNYTAEWVNNLYVGESGEHAGFSQASRTRVLPFAQQYLRARGLIQENLEELADTDQCVKIWLMGLSRGAAVMNVAAKNLTDSAGADKVYYYGFGTPVTTDNLEGAPTYTNLHNYIGVYDIFANMFASWGMTRYGVNHSLDLTENYQAVNDYLDSIDSHVHYEPETYEARTIPDLSWFINNTGTIADIWSQDLSTSEKLARITSEATPGSSILTPADFTRQTFAVLLEGESSTLAGSRQGYTANGHLINEEYWSSIQKGIMDLLLILQTPDLSDSIAESYTRYSSLVSQCTNQDNKLDQACWKAAISGTPYEQCYGSLFRDVLNDDCTSGIVLTPQVRKAGIDNVESLYLLLLQLVTTLSQEPGREMVATIVSDIYGSQQTLVYHLPEVNLAIMAVNNRTQQIPTFAPESQNIALKPGQTASFRLQADFADFAGVWLDGQRLSADQYTVREGSIVIELAPGVANNLSDGQHTLGIGLLSTHQIYQLPFTYTRPPQVEHQPLSPAPNNARASEAAEKICTVPAPIGEADLFQIDRQGDRATLYFTPVADYTDRYHVVFGYAAGDERFGGIAMQVDRAHNDGVLAVDINNLDPQRDSAFRVMPVNDCAVGSWSNWLTAKAAGRGSAWHKTYRYN